MEDEYRAAEQRSDWGFRLLDVMKEFAAEAVESDLFSNGDYLHLAIVKVATLHLLSCADLPGELETCERIVKRAFASAVEDMEAQRRIH